MLALHAPWVQSPALHWGCKPIIPVLGRVEAGEAGAGVKRHPPVHIELEATSLG